MERLPAARGAWAREIWDVPGDIQPERARDPARERLQLAVREAVRTALTAAQREAVELYFFHGLSQAEIASRLGVSQQVIHRRIHGARRSGRVVGGALARLRRALADALPPRE